MVTKAEREYIMRIINKRDGEFKADDLRCEIPTGDIHLFGDMRVDEILRSISAITGYDLGKVGVAYVGPGRYIYWDGERAMERSGSGK